MSAWATPDFSTFPASMSQAPLCIFQTETWHSRPQYHSLLQREHRWTAAFLHAAQVGCSINSIPQIGTVWASLELRVVLRWRLLKTHFAIASGQSLLFNDQPAWCRFNTSLWNLYRQLLYCPFQILEDGQLINEQVIQVLSQLENLRSSKIIVIILEATSLVHNQIVYT